jgi:hypothetical protein
MVRWGVVRFSGAHCIDCWPGRSDCRARGTGRPALPCQAKAMCIIRAWALQDTLNVVTRGIWKTVTHNGEAGSLDVVILGVGRRRRAPTWRAAVTRRFVLGGGETSSLFGTLNPGFSPT